MPFRDSDIAKAIYNRNVQSIVSLFFKNENNIPKIKHGFNTETELWDYKSNSPKIARNDKIALEDWAEMCKDILAFHNQKGGIIFFGIDDDFKFLGANTTLDSKKVNDKIKKYLPDTIWVEYHREFIQSDQRYLGIAIIQPRGPVFERFTYTSPKKYNGKLIFKKGDSAIRQGDSSIIIKQNEVNKFHSNKLSPILNKIYTVDESYFRILQPDYNKFVERKELCKEVLNSINDPRVSVTSLIGIGGVGKTATATWAVLEAYKKSLFRFIVSITAKDRELTAFGIKALEPKLTSFESLLNAIFDVLGFPELKTNSILEKEKEAKELLKNSDGLLYVDNLETVDDLRIIMFLDSLPVGVHAIVTSRRSRVRVATRPIEVKQLNEKEAISFIKTLSEESGLKYCSSFSKNEYFRIRNSCDGIPLAMRWTLTKSKTPQDALRLAENITHRSLQGEELLEFCFRRVFQEMDSIEKEILQILSIFNHPIQYEAIIVGMNMDGLHERVSDVIEGLIEDALVNRIFDTETNDYNFFLSPITKSFIYADVRKDKQFEKNIRKKLTRYFEANDIQGEEKRKIIRGIRQGESNNESALIDLAISAKRKHDIDGAEILLNQALNRNPRSWKASRELAELYRKKENLSEALKLYEQAAINSPRRGNDKALIYREWGMLLRQSGLPKATDYAIDKFEVSLLEAPNDEITLTAVSQLYYKKGMNKKVIEYLEPLINHPNQRTRTFVLPLLLKAYKNTNDILKIAQVKKLMEN
ncbi:MAG: hypothetical protein DWQ06_10245 [Calditrichaeota bacterium]|nr:MAG: hypothetical protein DWQ06_10245 [Calditrichota bacterium]